MLPTLEELEKCGIRIVECITQSNLIVLNMEDFNIILGIYWPSKYHACVDCFQKV